MTVEELVANFKTALDKYPLLKGVFASVLARLLKLPVPFLAADCVGDCCPDDCKDCCLALVESAAKTLALAVQDAKLHAYG